ncbi:MAG: CDP-glucose 4,6-dehydratase [Verrucomicrobiota bacterium]|nr:CDP-glucose 4,6-dehydratase [Verrucomicrobiota bacterium]
MNFGIKRRHRGKFGSLLMAVSLKKTFEGKSVFLTGHTGFKGAWTALWLSQMGSEVHGLSLDEKDLKGIFRATDLASCIQSHELGDILDDIVLEKSFKKADPDFVFHFAAQPLVRDSYKNPKSTYAANVTGTINLLELLRGSSKPCVAIFVTSDKCYENLETGKSFKETDSLGGHDPYSSSKACCEIIVSSWRNSFFALDDKVRIASVRAGNVIGGGDWNTDRLLPDAVRCLSQNEKIPVRNPNSIRPWQHVLDPIHGYLRLAQAIHQSPSGSKDSLQLCSAFNFGPNEESEKTVEQLISEVLKHWDGNWQDVSNPNDLYEAKSLRLNVNKATSYLNWRPIWSFQEAIRQTVYWYKSFYRDQTKLLDITIEQIRDFELSSKTL